VVFSSLRGIGVFGGAFVHYSLLCNALLQRIEAALQ
jgi:hypothetical protein